jgi:hypothetical protein
MLNTEHFFIWMMILLTCLDEIAALLSENVRLYASGRLSVLDIIERRKTKHTAQEFRRLCARWPELVDRVSYEQTSGQGQRPSPTIAPEHVAWLLRILASAPLRVGKPPKTRPKAPLVAIESTRKPIFNLGPDKAPYGWRWDDGILSPVHGEQQAIKYMKKLRAFGERFKDIAAQLIKDQILPRPGDTWTEERVEEIIAYDHAPHHEAYMTFWQRWRYFGSDDEEDEDEEIE